MSIASSAYCTIGLPMRNAERTLAACVRSIFAQSFTDWRLVLLDDGSSDRTVQLARQISDPRVEVVADGENRGLAVRLNQLASLAHSEFIFRMDADDIMFPDRLRKQMEILTENTRLQVLGSAAIIIDDNDQIMGQYREDPFPTSRAESLRRVVFAHPTVGGRTSWFRQNPYDTSFPRGQDRELWSRTFAVNEFGRLKDPLLFYRVSGHMNLNSYASSKKADRRVLWTYGRREMSLRSCSAEIVKSYGKQLVYSAAQRIGVVNRIQQARHIPLSERELSQFSSQLELASAGHVCGWDR